MSQLSDHLNKESLLNRSVFALIVSCLLTGFATYLIDIFSVWQQWTVLAHMVLGAVYSVIVLPYFYHHFRRTLGFRRAIMLFTGIILFVSYLCAALTGWYLIYQGQQESMRWLLSLHIYANICFIVILTAHIWAHIKLMPANRAKSQQESLPSLSKPTQIFTLRFAIGIQLIVIVLTLAYSALQPQSKPLQVVEAYQYDYGPHPFRPSQSETSTKDFIATEDIANSHRCLNCHQEIGEQWFASVHQQAAADPTYVTNITLLEKNKGISATRYCEGCHAPVALLTGQLSLGGKHGGVSGTPAFDEGVGCMGCHGIKRLANLRGVASYEFTPAKDYLFAGSDNSVLTRINNQLMRLKPQQHINDVGHDLLDESAFCASCHTQFMDKDLNSWGWVKMQDEYGDWLTGPHSGQNEQNFSSTQAQNCQDCHMPLANSIDPSANKDGQIRSHNFPGANTFLPLLRGDHQQFELVKRFLQANKLRVSIDKPSRTDAIQSRDFIDENIRTTVETTPFYYLGEEVNINVVVSNVGVGHNFPGGTLDINQAWLQFTVHDAEGNAIYSSGEISANGFVDPKAHFYRSLPVDRKGNLVWRHDLFNMIGESFKRVVPAGGSDIANYRFTIPAWAKHSITLSATLKYRKLNKRYASWALKNKDFDIPAIDVAWDSTMIPLKIRKEVETNTPEPISGDD